jgi:hypothetical protein
MKPYERYAGPLFYSESAPNYNSLTGSMTSDYNGEIHGTDPASFAAEEAQATAAFPGVPKMPKIPVGSILRGAVGALVAVIIVALGLWVIVKQ